MNLAKVSWKNVWAKPWSTVLSVILIAFGVGLLSLLFIFKKQFTEQFDRNQAGVDMVAGAKGSPLQLILNSMFHVDAPTGNIKVEDAAFLFNPKNPYIEDAVPLSIGDSYKTFRIVGTDNSILEFYDAKIDQGRITENVMEVIVGAEVQAETQLKIGSTFFSSHGFNEGDLEHDHGAPFKVVGILGPHNSVMDKLIITDYRSIWEVHESHDHSSDTVSVNQNSVNDDLDSSVVATVPPIITDFPDKDITSILVRFKADKKRAIPVINMPRNINENTAIMATSPTYQLNKLLANLGAALKAVSYLAILIGLISALSVFISLYNNLKERKHELAMMRVAGASPTQLSALILMEALFIGLIGALLGVLLAHVGLWIISGLLNAQFHYALDAWRLNIVEIALIVGTCLLSLLAGAIPAIRAYRTNIIDSI